MRYLKELISLTESISEEMDKYKDDPIKLATQVREHYWQELKYFLGLHDFEMVNELVSVPWLTDHECNDLLKLVSEQVFKPNPDEDITEQIPEYIVEGITKNLLELKFKIVMKPIIFILTGLIVDPSGSIQIAKYSYDGVNTNGWHLDEDSDVTVTVALNNSYEGGGFELVSMDKGICSIQQHDYVVGEANIFKGRTTLHRGAKVIEGDKYLLVFWCKLQLGNNDDY